MRSEGSGLGTQLLGMAKEEVISSHLFSFGDSPAGDDDDFVLFVKCHNFRHTVRGTGMINVPGQWDRVSDARQLSRDNFGSLLAYAQRATLRDA
jgi:hypothetical protein